MQPQALTRVDGTVLGVRQLDYPARDRRVDEAGRELFPAMPARTVYEVDVASAFSRYDGALAANLTAVLPVVFDDTEPLPGVGEVVSLLVFPYASTKKTPKGDFFNRAAHRHVAAVPPDVPVSVTRAS